MSSEQEQLLIARNSALEKELAVKNRELAIEAALEQVRARTIAMQKSAELGETASLLFQQVTSLGIESYATGFTIWENNDQDLISWMCNADGSVNPPFKMPAGEIDWHRRQYESWKNKEDHLIHDFSGDAMQAYYNYLRSFPLLDEAFKKSEAAGVSTPSRQIHNAFNFSHGNLLFITLTAVPEAYQIFSRFAKVFEQTYTRFLDLQKVEAQTREAEIQLSLERVRARTMAMQKSEELLEAGELLCNEMTRLGIKSLTSGYVLMDKEERIGWNYTPNPGSGKIMHTAVGIPHTETRELRKVLEYWKKQEPYSVVEMNEEETITHQVFIASQSINFPISVQELLAISPPCIVLHNFNFREGYIMIVGGEKLTEEQQQVMLRFARVFQQTYTRFLDLQKAEAQAREAQIEAALERVRGKAMAMHNSQDLADTIGVFYREMQSFSLTPLRCGVGLLDREERVGELFTWNTTEQGESLELVGKIKMEGHPVLNKVYEGWLTATEYYPVLRGNEIKAYYQVLRPQIAFPDYHHDDVQYGNFFFFKEGGVYAWTEKEMKEDERNIYRRFTSVLSLTYKRYRDLQNAEARTRAAQIEAALERVRARTMAMQKSEDMNQTASEMFNQIELLGMRPWGCGFNIFDEDEKAVTQYMSLADGGISPPFRTPLTEDPFFISIYDARQRHDELLVMESSGETLAETYRYMFSLPGSGEIFGGLESAGFEMPKQQLTHCAYFSQGYLVFITYEPVTAAHDIFKRFAKVFEQTYTRFLDLQKAEAQALEATRRASVDRIRAEIASMRTTDDLERITPLIWTELTTLGVPFFRCGMFIMNDSDKKAQIFLSTPDGSPLAALHMDFESSATIHQASEHWRAQQVYREHWDQQQFLAWVQSLIEQGQQIDNKSYQAGDAPPETLTLQFIPFKQGMLYIGSEKPLPDTQVALVQELANAFSVAYARYEDFKKLEDAKLQIEKTLIELKDTQKQLIQSEKMASLGELTAGIAHEIQNPLNFVNNFSDVNTELIGELKEELAAGNLQLATEIADDIQQNEAKINHHGKRADGIVKGMLQHSRSNTGEKEATDINKLADEYLRLSYHGMRSKDNNFNVDMKTVFDETVGLINAVPQDIGRVLLNLYNNAFYAVNEKAKSQPAGYKPAITVTTKKINGKIEISVTDNGNGIPQNIVDKIFQPFFTTKPTGSGTGLGLSLSYDIVKAHGGEIKVNSREGSAFIILLPA
ncbi:MAG TPA: ATP-binding protein [Panacibacter sp.]|nr:ATP-binding protein [Panacibacter sp.]HNP46372.1 ATP-binding protein [Panacibacter sp.]